MGEIGGEKVYIRGKKYEEWKNKEIIIDVVKGRGGMLQIEKGREVRFMKRQRVCQVK